MKPFFTQDTIVFGLLMLCLAAVFYTANSQHKVWKSFYKVVPPILVCYFLPALLHWPLGLIASDWYEPGVLDLLREQGFEVAEGANVKDIIRKLGMQGIEVDGVSAFRKESGLYFMASRYLLPASLVLLCISIDLKGIINLGPKALIMFFAATLGIVLGGPLAVLIVSNLMPGAVGVSPEELWRGLSTIAGSWIGGGANQTAMKEIFGVGDGLFATMVVVDVIVGNIWLGFLLYGANISDRIDRWLKADNSAIEDLKNRVEQFQASVKKIPTTKDLFVLLGIAFGATAMAHWGAELIIPGMESIRPALERYRLTSLLSSFFWLIVIATSFGLLLSFTKARNLEGVGASRWGSIFIYILVATIGMRMDLGDIFKNFGLFGIGIIWMLMHVFILVVIARIIRAPFFFVAVGSQANVGGAASAPVIASAFSPALAPVGVLMAVLGYALGTYMALVCAYLMQLVAT